MASYAIHAQVITHDGDFAGSRSVPTFYLDSRVQGITGPEHAARVAADIINPLGAIAADDLRISAVQVDPVRESAELDQHAAEQGYTEPRGRHVRTDGERRSVPAGFNWETGARL